jgi:uncharacterized protein (TIGR02996 family)
MSSDKGRDFLEVILAHPDEDTPRLLYADWLDEQGDAARAEFIRVQIERARLPHWAARQVRLRARERELLDNHGPRWMKELPKIKGVTWERFRRGLVGTASFSSFAVFQASAAACWAAAPIEAVSVPWPRRHEPPETAPAIPGLRELSMVGGAFEVIETTRLGEAPLLSTLWALNIRECNLRADAFRVLVTSPHLANLKALRVPFNSLGNSGVHALCRSGSVTSLEVLDLSERASYGRYGEDPIVDAEGMEVLAAWRGLVSVRSLTLSGSNVDRRGLRALVRSAHVIYLKELSLRANGLRGVAIQELTEAQPALQLDVLDLGGNLLRDLGCTYLASADCLRELKVLVIDQCEMTTSAARRLVKAPFLHSLRRLNVNDNSLRAEGLYTLLEKRPHELHTLHVANNDLGDDGISDLASSPASDTLLALDLAQNEVDDDGVHALIQSKHLKTLLVLQLNDNPISNAAIVDLEESPLGKRLAVLRTEDEDHEEDEELQEPEL